MTNRSLALAVLALLPATVRGQTVEITPVAGYRFGGSFDVVPGAGTAEQTAAHYEVADAASFGAHLAFRVSADGEVEVLYARQATRVETGGLFTGVPLFDLTLETWQAGGNYLIGEESARLRPYVGAALGVTVLRPASPLRNETRFSASFAGGLKIRLQRHLALRLEARGFFTVLESDDVWICPQPGACNVHARGTDISQADLRAGLSIRF